MNRVMRKGKKSFAPTTVTAALAAIALAFAACGGDGGGKDAPGEPACGEWETAAAPTCNAAGEETRGCSDGTEETRPVAKLDWQTATIPATCAAEGVKTKACPDGSEETKPILRLSCGGGYTPPPPTPPQPPTPPATPSSSSSSATPSSNSITPSSSSTGYAGAYGSVADACGKQYKTVVIGTQTWMAENLNCGDGACYENNPANCAKYGMLYDWATALNICPSGWHLPTKDEGDILSSYVQSTSGCTLCDGKLLKTTSGWNDKADGTSGNGLDTYGFAALPGGSVRSDFSTFFNVGNLASLWSAWEIDGSSAETISISNSTSSEASSWSPLPKTYGASVRCVKD